MSSITTDPVSAQLAAATPQVMAATVRDPRLDFYRGMAMFIILFAHTPGNFFTSWIPARWGFSDATEMFVFCSGMASAIAFGRTFERAGWGLGTARVAYTSKETGFDRVPTQSQLNLDPKAAYFHYTSNNTIMGTQYHYVPEAPEGVPLICDASSDIFSEPIDVTKYAMIYAGAQKNIGPAGTTLVIIRKDLLERSPKKLPGQLSYKVFADKQSRPNTPPVFPIYAVSLVFQWILDQGGLEPIAQRNQAKAKLIYDVVDGSSFYTGHAQPESRSLMNLTFATPSAETDALFVAAAAKEALTTLKGYRTLGGVRASIYNAFPTEGCEALAAFMREFERTHG